MVVVLLLQPDTYIWPLTFAVEAIQCSLPAYLSSSLFAGCIASISSLRLGGGEQQWMSGGVLALGMAAATFAVSAACTEHSPAMTTQRSFSDCYELLENVGPIGMGGFGAVLAAQHKETGELVAVKKIPRLAGYINDCDIEGEVQLLKLSGEHRYIISFYDVFKDEDYYYLVMELALGGELFDHVMNHGMLTEAESAQLMSNLLQACSFLHEQGIVHGDIKPENIILGNHKKPESPSNESINGTSGDSNTDEIDVRLADFGTATLMDPSRNTCTISQNSRITAPYCPPEVIKQQKNNSIKPVEVDIKTDVWALGVILYILLYGRHPYDLDASASEEEMVERILYTHPKFSDPNWDVISPSGVDLLKNMMHQDPDQRPTCHEALSHEWFRERTGRSTIKRRVTREIRDFTAGRRMMKACLLATMIGLVKRENCTTRSPIHTGKYAIGSRYTACEMIDREKKGYIDVSDIMSVMEQLGEGGGGKEASMMLHAVDGDYLSFPSRVLYDQMAKLVTPLCPPRVVKPGGEVYSEGEMDDMFYLIRHGAVDFSLRNPQKLCTSDITHPSEYKLQSLHAGESFGEVELVLKKGTIFPRLATCKCSSSVDNCELLMLQEEQFRLLTDVFDSVNAKIQLQSEVRFKAMLAELYDSLDGYIMTLQPGQKLENARGVVVIEKGTVKVHDVWSHHALTLGPKDHYFVCGPEGIMPYLGRLNRAALYVEGIEGEEPSQVKVIPEAVVVQLLQRKSMAGARKRILRNGV